LLLPGAGLFRVPCAWCILGHSVIEIPTGIFYLQTVGCNFNKTRKPVQHVLNEFRYRLLPKWTHSYYNSNNTSERSAVVELKVRKFGNSLGVVLPKEVINRLHTRDGEPLFLIEASEGGYLLTPYDPGFEEKMAKAEDIISRYRNTLHVLAK
jgi:putative addiction module antidote